MLFGTDFDTNMLLIWLISAATLFLEAFPTLCLVDLCKRVVFSAIWQSFTINFRPDFWSVFKHKLACSSYTTSQAKNTFVSFNIIQISVCRLYDDTKLPPRFSLKCESPNHARENPRVTLDKLSIVTSVVLSSSLKASSPLAQEVYPYGNLSPTKDKWGKGSMDLR